MYVAAAVAVICGALVYIGYIRRDHEKRDTDEARSTRPCHCTYDDAKQAHEVARIPETNEVGISCDGVACEDDEPDKADVAQEPGPNDEASRTHESAEKRLETTRPEPLGPRDEISRAEHKANSKLMPPPPRPTKQHVARPMGMGARPSNAAVARQQAALAPSTSTMSPAARPRKKVILQPGHSPLDWAALIRSPPSATFLRGDDVPVDKLIAVSPAMLRQHSGRKGKNAWGVFQGKVYNMTPYMDFHPGGVDQLMRGAGKEKEGEQLFMEVHPWINWDNMLSECLIGVLVEDGVSHQTMDDMD